MEKVRLDSICYARGMDDVRLERRRLGRAEREIAPVIWEIDGSAARVDEDLLGMMTRVGATWIVGPRTLDVASSDQVRRVHAAMGNEMKLIVPVTATSLESRKGRAVETYLEVVGVTGCEAVLLEGATPGDVKAGGMFHRLSRLRENGVVGWFIISAQDYAEAEWMVHHSPAHAVCLPFGLGDMTAEYRVLEDARNYGTGVIARAVEQRAWDERYSLAEDVAFVTGEATAVMQPIGKAREVLEGLRVPMSEETRSGWWGRFSKRVGEPAKPVRNLPPEFG